MMPDYIDFIKKMFSDSERIVIVFENKENIWCNRSEDFFGGKLPQYNDIIIGSKKENGCGLFSASLITDDFKMKGEFFDDRENNRAVVLLDKRELLFEAFEDSDFLSYIDTNNFYLKTAVNELFTFISYMRTQELKGKRVQKEFDELYRNMEESCLTTMKVVHNNEIMKITSKNMKNCHRSTLLNIRKLLELVSYRIMMYSDKVKIKLNLPKNIKIYTRNDFYGLRFLFIYAYRYIVFSSCSRDISVTLEVRKDNTIKINMICSKKNNGNVGTAMEFYDKIVDFNMEELIFNRLSESIGVPFEKKEADKKIILSMVFQLFDTPEFEEPFPEEKHLVFTPEAIAFSDFII